MQADGKLLAWPQACRRESIAVSNRKESIWFKDAKEKRFRTALIRFFYMRRRAAACTERRLYNFQNV